VNPNREDLERLDRMATLGDLLAEVAHEVRNPLVSMKTFLQLLPDHQGDQEFTEDFRKVVLDELGRMERLLDALLRQAAPDNTRIAEQHGPASSQLAEVFDALSRLLEKRAGHREVKLSTSIEATLPEVAIAEDPLRQILMNLVLNALDAAPASSCVTLRASASDGAVTFSVEDEGDGVPDGLRERLFEPYFSTREDRSGGLGLTIAKRLVEEAGGTIGVEAGHAGGARFVVLLPRVP
jgi:signal transduction histidine kinase